MMKLARFGIALVLLATLGACVGPTLIVERYPGPHRPAEEVSTLRFYGNDRTLLVVVDGERADVQLAEDVRLHIEVLPGKHHVGVVPREDMQGPVRMVVFEALPGRTYRFVFAQGASDRARAYEVDPDSDAMLRDVTIQ